MIRKIRGGFLLLAFAAVLVSCAGRPVYATEASQDDAAASGETDSEEELTPEEALKKELDTVYQMEVQSNSWKNWPEGPGTYGEAAIVMDAGTGAILYAKNIDAHHYPASITKIMTALLAIEYGNMEDVVTIQAEDVNLEEGSVLSGMQAGDQVTMDQLFYTLVVYSANDAGMAIARHIGGTVEEFVNLMNQEAQNLGMTGTHFVNPHGLHDDNHYTTVYDIYLMLNRAFSEQKYTEAMSMESYTLTVTAADGTQRTRYLTATDQYLTGAQTAPENVTVLGGKTGTTSKAGSCLALVSQNAYGEPFISIVVNAANKTDLYNDMNTLLSQIN